LLAIPASPRENPALIKLQRSGKIRIAFGQRPNHVQAVRQHANCDCLERMAFLHGWVDAPESIVCRTRTSLDRSANVTVKKKTPP
jgi:hypothetical protein